MGKNKENTFGIRKCYIVKSHSVNSISELRPLVIICLALSGKAMKMVCGTIYGGVRVLYYLEFFWNENYIYIPLEQRLVWYLMKHKFQKV